MNMRYKEDFEELRKHCKGLSASEFDAVTEYIVENAHNHIDVCSDGFNGRYFYKSAVSDVVEKFGFSSEDALDDVDLLAFEFSLFAY